MSGTDPVVHPGWIVELPEYWEWLDRQVAQAGGHLTNRQAITPQVTADPQDPDEWVILHVSQHTLVYGDFYLAFEITVVDGPEQIFYSYQHGKIGGPTIWRACYNGHHRAAIGSDLHIHINEDEKIFRSDEIDLQDAIRAMQNAQIPGIAP